MNRVILLSAVFLLLGVSAYGQLHDSLIVGSVEVDSGNTFVFLPVYAVTFDSVYFYAMTFGVRSETSGININPNFQYGWPVAGWTRFDSVMQYPSRIFLLGFAENSDPIFSDGNRLLIWTMPFNIAPDAPPQDALIDTFGGLGFGINPVFVPGHIVIRYPTGVDNGVRGIPNSFTLSQNYPNPFNSSTLIAFSVPEAGYTSLVIYDLMGRRIRTLLENNIAPGEYNVLWDGKDDWGIDAVSGTYFYRLTSTNRTENKKMLVIR